MQHEPVRFEQSANPRRAQAEHLIPPRLELKKQLVAAARPAGGAGRANAADKPGGTPTKSADAPKPKKPQVETGMDEFK